MSSLLFIKRIPYHTKTRKQSCEVAFWVINQVLDEQRFANLIEVTRRHWAGDPHHYIRDVQLGEDKMVTRSPMKASLIAVFITMGINILAGQSQNLLELWERLTRNQALADPLLKRNKVF